MRPLPLVELTPGRLVGDGQPCYIVAEIGQNHNGQVSIARQLIEGAAAAGADAVKFCKRDIASDLSREASQQPYLSPHSFGPTYGQHRQFLELSAAQHAELAEFARARGVCYFATACDPISADELQAIGVPMFKLASRDLTNLPLVEHLARTGKPLILSCGMDGPQEIAAALATVRGFHNRLILLQCTSAYPTPYEHVNLRAMPALREEFSVLTGMSDHSLGPAVPVAAVALGAVMIEKHITLDHRMKGTDHACSLTIEEFAQMVCDLRRVETALGDGIKRVPPSVETARRRLRRALVARRFIPRGTRLTPEMLCLKSAGGGLSWHDRDKVLGRVTCCDIAENARLEFDHLGE
jgi:sialic acid synthase SpsE